MSRHHPFFEKGGLMFVGFTKHQERALYWGDNPKDFGIEQGKGKVMASLLRFRQKAQ